MSKKCHVLFVRHGERLDEVDRYRWMREATDEDHHDPPLTDRGRLQAQDAARLIKEELGERPKDEVKLYVSPSVRTLATAAELGTVLGLEEMKIAPGLYACAAAAQHFGLENLFFAAPGTTRFTDATRDKLEPHPEPLGHTNDTFEAAVHRIVDATPDGHTAIIVTHREGMYSHNEQYGQHIRVHYCCTCVYSCTYDPETPDSREWVMHGAKIPKLDH